MSDLSEAANDASEAGAEPAAGPLFDLGAAAIDLFYGARALYSVFVQTLSYSLRG